MGARSAAEPKGQDAPEVECIGSGPHNSGHGIDLHVIRNGLKAAAQSQTGFAARAGAEAVIAITF